MQSQLDIWPCHPHPLPDELLTCWLVRIAHAHQLKVQSFCHQVFGPNKQIWNRDIDRLAPLWVMDKLSKQTSTPAFLAQKTTLAHYRDKLYTRHRSSGTLQWILPLEMWHRKHMGHGLQYCPRCLAEGSTPYYRRRWRVALYTVCTKHNCMMKDRCPACGAGVAFHRTEQGRYEAGDLGAISFCHACFYDLKTADCTAPEIYDHDSFGTLNSILTRLEAGLTAPLNLGFMSVLHQLCKIILTKNSHTKLQEYACREMDVPLLGLGSDRKTFEERSLAERHHVIQLATWLITEPKARIMDAWRSKAVRYNHLKKDFLDMPTWYQEIVGSCANWRERRTQLSELL